MRNPHSDVNESVNVAKKLKVANFVTKIWSNNMNMISTAFPIEMDASIKQKNLVSGLVSVWEKKNSKTARAGGLSLMALSLAACGAEDASEFTQADVTAAATAATAAAQAVAVDEAAAATIIAAATQELAVAEAVAAAEIVSAAAATAAAEALAADEAGAAAIIAQITQDAAVAAAVAAVDITTDNAAAHSLALRNSAAEAGVTGTSTMTDAELMTAIKASNDAGLADAAVAALGLAGVTTLAGLNTAYTALANPAVTAFSLTTSSDSIVGSAGDDTINATFSTGAGMTFQAGDTVNGGNGTDTLVVTVGTLGTHQISSMSSVEVVNATFTAAGVLSMLGSSGVTTVNAQGSTAAASFTNIPLGTALEAMNTGQNATFAFKASDVTGSSDTATLTLKNVTAGTMTVAGIETLNVVSSLGGNSLTGLTAAAANSITITGDQTLSITAANTAAETIDGSAATAALTLTTDNTNNTTVTGGSGNDSITSAGSNATTVTINAGAGNDTITHTLALTGADIIDGGDGTDTLVSTGAQLKALTINTTTAAITNIEAITVSDEYVDTTNAINTSGLIQATGIQTVNLANADTTAADDITTGAEVLIMSAGANTLNLGTSEAGNQSHLGGVLTVNDTGTAITDSITVNNLSLNSTTGANVEIGDFGISTTGFIFGGYESVTFDTGQGSGNIEQKIATLDVNPDVVTADVSLTLTGKNAIDLSTDVTTSSTGKLTIDASGLTAQTAGVTTFDLASTVQGVAGTLAVTGSEGDDIIVTGAFAATVSGGAGVDVITGSAANDTLTGGAGNDTLTAGGGTDTINGGDGNDTLTLTTAGTYTATGGAGTDTANFGGTLTQADSFDGGDGIDTITVTNASVTAINALSVSNINTLNAGIVNVEKLNLSTDLNQNLDVGRIDGLSDIIIGNLAGAAVLTGIGATNNIEIVATTGQTLGLTLADATGTADVVNINLSGVNLVAANTVTVANVETINITGSDQAAANAATVNTMTLAATKATSIVVTGSDGLDLTNTGNTKVTNFDASAVAATNASDTVGNMAVTFASANTSTVANVTIKGGAGEDVLTGNLGIDTITGGAAADNLVASAGNDVLSGGAGNDTMSFTVALLAANSATTATFAGGTGTDILDLTNNTATIVDADFRGMTSIETFTSGNATNSLTFGVVADGVGFTTITGGTGADTINASDVDFDNALTITGGTGTDTISLNATNAVVDKIVGNGLVGNSAVANASSLTGTVAAADTLTFLTNGVDIVQGFSSTDTLDMTNAGVITNDIIGLARGSNIATGALHIQYGTFASSVFTMQNGFSAINSDALIAEGDAGSLTFLTFTGYTVLEDLSAAIATTQIV
jgi:hypothetical protein